MDWINRRSSSALGSQNQQRRECISCCLPSPRWRSVVGFRKPPKGGVLRRNEGRHCFLGVDLPAQLASIQAMPPLQPKRSRQLQAAKRHLSEAQLIAFLRAANDGDTTSVKITVRGLDEGSTLEELLAPVVLAVGELDLGTLTVELKVKPLGPHSYEILFGHHGPGYGDGGTWKVVYDANGQVQELVNESSWIH